MNPVLVALGLTLFAGMATGIGSVIAFTAKRTNFRFLSIATGFSAGVMLYVSFVEILVKGGDALAQRYGEAAGNWINAAAFFGGMLLIGLIDNLIPAAENPHETHAESETRPLHDPNAPIPDFEHQDETRPKNGEISVHDHAHHHHKLMRMGLFTALAIGIHNFPEGMATFVATLQDPKLGLPIAVAIAIHNIPEGIAVSVPVYYASGSRRQAFTYSFLSGLAEPVGALLAFLLLQRFINGAVSGLLFGAVAGIMVFISLDELLPTAQRYGEHHVAIYGLLGGMAVMALSLLLFL